MDRRFLDALACRNKGRPPVWLMRQAGRYMPEYRALRHKFSFLDMCHTPELAAEVTQLPINTFGFDAAILFSDILVTAEALNVGLRFEEKAGPVIEKPIRTPADVLDLPQVHAHEKLSYVSAAIQLLKKTLKVPLIGFCGAPFTVASYMIEGGSSRTLHRTKKWMLQDPVSFHLLLDKITHLTQDYLRLQIAAGVDAIQIFDSWTNYLAFPHFKEFSSAYLKKLQDVAKESQIPVIFFCKGSSAFVHELAQLNPSGISIDWNADLSALRHAIKHPIALQGNLDPDVLYASPTVVQKEVRKTVLSMQNDTGYIFNLGHGILPDIPVDSVKALVEAIQQ
jgi:uroporphyrinogen decarboxylase